MVELNISEKTYILPSAMVGVKEVLQIADNGNGDCVEVFERETNNKKGFFSQYALTLRNKDGEERTANFLLSQHLRPLMLSLGKKTQDWIGNYVSVEGVPEEKDGKTYYSLSLRSVGVPEWAEEKV